MTTKRISVILSAYNEEKTIYDVIGRIPNNISKDLEVIVVDDGSTDGTSKEAKRAEACVFHHRKNIGVGAAMKTGVKASLENHSDIIVKMDADGQHDPAEIPKLIKPILDDEADLVVGARSREVFQEMPLLKRYGNLFLSWLVRLLGSCQVYDSQSGFRAMTRKLIQSISFDSKYTYTQEMIIKAARKGFRIKEVQIHCSERSFGNSKVVSNVCVYGMKVLPIIIRACGDWASLESFAFSILAIASIITIFFFVSFQWI